MAKYSAEYMPSADSDVDEIIDYLAERNVSAAKDFLDRLDERVEQLCDFPESAPVAKDRQVAQKGYRVLVIEGYLLFYLFKNEVIYIMRVIDGRRNYSEFI